MCGQNLILCGRCRALGTFVSAWQAQYFVHLAKALAGVGRNERSFFVASTVFGELGTMFWKASTISFCETVVISDLVHGDNCRASHTGDATRIRVML